MQDHARFAPLGTLRRFAYALLWFSATAFYKAAAGCVYLAAGLLRRADLREASKRMWASQAPADVDIGLEAWEQRVYDSVLRPHDHILLIGCGEGRDLIALLAQGYAVTGLEQSPELVQRARAHLDARRLPAIVIEATIENAVLDAAYDVMIFSVFSYGLIPGSTERIKTLTRLRSCLSSGGRIICSYLMANGHSQAGLRLTRASAQVTRSDWLPEPGDTIAAAPGDRRVLFYQHYFRPDSFAAECRKAGLQIVRADPIMPGVHCAVLMHAGEKPPAIQDFGGSAESSSDSRSRISIPAVTSALPPILIMLS
jgi:SAM-dependent methyltransferase